ncbi:Two-component response regulator [uncultured Eubacteriales bacterium]|uniref:Stage 0 sporulation protein A homolog n=1 Tax=uncultured Eubacteriales bacterium TaxID=172733 RepID=A0A212KG38_9FIRM|nr:Two-component response regulator [uncultured Eubacteriales bacterium]
MLKVLVVEDEEMLRKGIVLAVDWAALDCVVVGEAANGEEALEEIERYEPSLIITDLHMPKMGGIEMLQKLRERGDKAFAIILTAYDSFAYAQSALRLGAVDFLLKPFHDGELEKSIMAVQKRLKNGGDALTLLTSGMKKGDKSRYVLEAMNYIGEHYNDPNITVGVIAQSLGISEGHLSHIFKKETDYTLLNYLTRHRVHKSMELLKIGRLKVYEVADKVGYRDITYFSTTFKKLVGISPSEYQDTCR